MNIQGEAADPPGGVARAPGRSRRGQRSSRTLHIVLAAQAVWGLWFIWRTSFVAGGRRTFCLLDDAMISLTYARNLVEGHGLNWARFGAPVEGFSHPLWTSLMVGVHLLSLPRAWTSLAVQLASLVLLLATTATAAKLANRHFAPPPAASWLVAALPTAFFYPLQLWALQGMETALVAWLCLLVVGWSLDLVTACEPEGAAATTWRLGWALAAAYATRMDLLLLAVVVFAFLARHLPQGGSRRTWLALAGPLGLVAVAGQLLRWRYFRDWLPNTYYLKLTGVPLEVRLLKGLASFVAFARPLLWLWLALLVANLFTRLDRRPAVRLVGLVTATYFAYSIWVGGDVWEKAGVGANRFVAFVMPLVFLLVAALSAHLVAAWKERWAFGRAGTGPLLATVAIVLTLAANGLLAPAAAAAWDRQLVLDLPLHVAENRRFTREVLALEERGLVAPDARVAVVWAGIPAYFSKWEMVDVLGYNDRRLARQASAFHFDAFNYRDYLPGHSKMDWAYTLETYRPDLVFQTYGLPRQQLAALMRQHGYAPRQRLWLRIDSRKVAPEGWAAALAAAE